MTIQTSWERQQERDRARRQKRVDSAAKEGPPIEFRFRRASTPGAVGELQEEDVVVLTKQPMEYTYPASGPAGRDLPSGQKFKSLYRVDCNGVHRGWIIAHTGWGTKWELQRLDTDGRPCFWVTGPVTVARLTGEGARDKLAARVPEKVLAGELGTVAEQKKAAREELRRKAADEQRRAEEQQASRIEGRANLVAELSELNGKRATIDALIERMRRMMSNEEVALLADVSKTWDSEADEIAGRIGHYDALIARHA